MEFQSPTSRGDLCNARAACSSSMAVMWFQSPTSRGDLCNRYFELGRPFLASPHEALRRRFVVGPNWAGGGQPPPLEAGFGVGHPIGALDSEKMIAIVRMRATILHAKVMIMSAQQWMICCRTVIDWWLRELGPAM
jgi:hypothetical protein